MSKNDQEVLAVLQKLSSQMGNIQQSINALKKEVSEIDQKHTKLEKSVKKDKKAKEQQQNKVEGNDIVKAEQMDNLNKYGRDFDGDENEELINDDIINEGMKAYVKEKYRYDMIANEQNPQNQRIQRKGLLDWCKDHDEMTDEINNLAISNMVVGDNQEVVTIEEKKRLEEAEKIKKEKKEALARGEVYGAVVAPATAKKGPRIKGTRRANVVTATTNEK